LCDPSGGLHLVELKKMSGQKVPLSSHQISFLTRHKHASAWVLIKAHIGKQKDYKVFLYRGAQAIALFENGLRNTEPVVLLKEKPLMWAKIFEEMKNVGSDS
jgi:hypothetical protein